jgi:Zn-dependent M28 family amino/carboxypeptidase
MLEVSAKSYRGDRRSSISSLTQLESGTVLSTSFPSYTLSADYQHPLDQAGQDLEKATVATITPDSAMDYLKKLVQLPTRSYSNATASAKAEAFLKSEFEAMGLHVCYHTFDNSGSKMTNVIAHLPGNDRLGAVIVGAHYDSRPFEGAAPGAEDNGSGVASLLALASAFMKSKAQPKKSVYFVGFGGEEPGLIGSAHFAKALSDQALPSDCTATSFLQTQPRKRTILRHERKVTNADYSAIIMDEVGWLSKGLPTSPANPTVNLEAFDTNKDMMNHLRHSSEMHNGNKIEVVHNGKPFGSDHMSFSDQGMSSTLTINGDDESYPHYHQHTDTIDNVDANLMQMVTKMNLGAMMRMSLA